jgi:hypothetical protein
MIPHQVKQPAEWVGRKFFCKVVGCLLQADGFILPLLHVPEMLNHP